MTGYYANQSIRKDAKKVVPPSRGFLGALFCRHGSKHCVSGEHTFRKEAPERGRLQKTQWVGPPVPSTATRDWLGASCSPQWWHANAHWHWNTFFFPLLEIFESLRLPGVDLKGKERENCQSGAACTHPKWFFFFYWAEQMVWKKARFEVILKFPHPKK